MRRRLLALAAAALLAVPAAAWSQALDQLLEAANAGDAKTVATLLNKGLDPNSTDKQGNTLLMIAAVHGHEALVKLLVERKADLRLRSPVGDSALMLASLKGHLGVVKLLVEGGAPLTYPGSWSPLHYAAFEGRPEVVRYLLDKGTDKNALAPNGYSALMLAARGGHMEAARMLLYEDADVNVKAPSGETVLSLIRKRKDPEFEELLKRAGAME